MRTLFVARKNLLEQPFRLAISVAGVGLSVMLVLVMWAILQGIVGQAGAFVRNTDAQVWIVQEGFTDISHGLSVVPRSLERRLERMPGVRDANPLTGARLELPVPTGGKDSLSIVGYDTRTGVGGPWSFAEGDRGPRRGEVVVDETFAETTGFAVGDELPVPGDPLRIVGLSAETNQFVNQIAFAPLQDVARLARLRADVNFFALRVREGRTGAVVDRIAEELDGVTAFTKAQFTANNEREVKEGFQPILYVMVAIAFGVGLAIVGLTMYTAAVEKAREFGILSAIGADRRALSRIVLGQALITSALGFVVGALLVVPAGWVIGELAPKTELRLTPGLFAVVAASSLLMAILASVVPVRRIAGLDPAAVFRA